MDHFQERSAKRNAVVVEKHVLRRKVLLKFRVDSANDAFAVRSSIGDEDHFWLMLS